MNRLQRLLAVALTIGFVVSSAASAYGHFVWLIRDQADDGSTIVRLAFAETPSPGGTDLFPVDRPPVLYHFVDKTRSEQVAKERDGSLVAICPKNAIVQCDYTYGLFGRDETPKLLRYYALTGPALSKKHATWNAENVEIDFAIIPTMTKGNLTGLVLWKGKPLAKAAVSVYSGNEATDLVTDEEGTFEIAAPVGTVGLRARYETDGEGSYDNESYAGEIHYATLVVNCQIEGTALSQQEIPALPEAVTSFGAAAIGDTCYVYGGHVGNAHEYSKEGHARHLLRFKPGTDKKWVAVAEGPPIQGLALVAARDHLYRIGGFTATNEPGDPQSLWSQTDVQRLDPAKNEWETMPALPEPRSSFDAIAVDGKIYVAGGWKMAGEESPPIWLKDVLMLDLDDLETGWQVIAELPQHVRAISLAHMNDQLFVIGGMRKSGGPTVEVEALDLKSHKWLDATDLPGKSMDGFGTAAVSMNNQIYVSNISGKVMRLAERGEKWENVSELEVGRFFHQMLPLSQEKLLIIAGANMSVGRFDDCEAVTIEK